MNLLPELSRHSWLLVGLAGVTIGFSKGGLSGVNMIGVIIFATVFPARQSTGMLLLPLIVGDLSSVLLFHQHGDWKQLRRIILPALFGIVIGWLCLRHLTDSNLRAIIGSIILILAIAHSLRQRLGRLIENSYHGRGFAWTMGSLGGLTTMLANAAGPVMSLFFLSMRLPKFVFVGTSAWFFFGVNLCKVPFSISLGLIHWTSLGLALCLAPIIFFSVKLGRWLLHHIPQILFERLILIFAIAGALKLIVN